MRHDEIPRNIREAARRAGLTLPLWYCGPRIDPRQPRKKTLADIVAEVEADESESAPEQS